MEPQKFTRRSFIKTTSMVGLAAANMSIFAGLASADGTTPSSGPNNPGDINKCPPLTVTWGGGPKTEGVTADCKKNGKFCCKAVWRNATPPRRGGHWEKA